MKTIRRTARDDAREHVDQQEAAKLKNLKVLKAGAHAEKRAWKVRAETGELLAEVRLVENKRLREHNDTLLDRVDELMAESRVLDDVANGVLISEMPTWRPVRTNGRGGGRAYDHDYRTTIYGMIAAQVPLSAIGSTIIDVVTKTAPWLEPSAPSRSMLTEARFELRFVEEALAARRVAAAYSIRMLGFDETTKKGNPGLTSNVIIEPEQGAELVPVILRGAYCSAGGTAEAIAEAIEQKCFARLRDLLKRWKAKFVEMFPGETWTGPEPEQLSTVRLSNGGAIMSDTCNTAQKAKTVLIDKIKDEVMAQAKVVDRKKVCDQEGWDEAEWEAAWEAWAGSDEARAGIHIHKLDCTQHLRNIFLNEMSNAQAKHVSAEELKPHLDMFSSWERMSTNYTDLLRAAYKEFHHGCAYYKGKGREFSVWLKEHHPTAFAMHFERAAGGRQDLDYDAALPLYIMRPYIVEYLHAVVFGADHSNVLEDFLYTSFRSQQFVAMTRANAVIDLTISRPLRWLCGSSHLLTNWSPMSMNRVFDLVEQFFVKASVNGSLFLDPKLNVYEEIAKEQPLFAAYLKDMYEEFTVVAADGKTKHLAYKLARDELLTPSDATNKATTARTIEYLEVQCIAGLRKLHDPKLYLANKLSSQDGRYAFDASSTIHKDTIGLDAANDRLAESVFGVYDYVLKRCPNISMEAASAVAMAMRAKSFAPGGFFHSLPRCEQEALVEVARSSVREMREVDAADHAAHDAYVTAKRKSNSQLELDALVKQYALAITFFKQWKKQGVESVADMTAALRGIEKTQDKLDYLRKQIDMRVIGLGFVEFKTPWSSSKDDTVGTVAHLSQLLRDILMEEQERSACGELPDAPVVPVMKRKTFKELGEPTAQAGELGTTIKELTPAELLALAQARRLELEVAGEVDTVGDEQDELPPKLDDSLVGSMVEICWRYWHQVRSDAGGEGRRREAQEVCCADVV